jgi:plasmid stability protein
MKPSDETLMAYADGQLTTSERQVLEAALATDADARSRLAIFAESRDLLRAALAAPEAEPVPERLIAAVLQGRPASAEAFGKVIARRERARTVRRWALPLAASLALGIGLAAGYGLAPSNADPLVAVAAAIGPALERSRSGEPTTSDLGEVMPLATVRRASGQFCREFEILPRVGDPLAGVACREDTGWRPVGLVALATAAPGDRFVPADGAARHADLLLQFLGEATVPVAAEAEPALLAGGWQAAPVDRE